MGGKSMSTSSVGYFPGEEKIVWQPAGAAVSRCSRCRLNFSSMKELVAHNAATHSAPRIKASPVAGPNPKVSMWRGGSARKQPNASAGWDAKSLAQGLSEAGCNATEVNSVPSGHSLRVQMLEKGPSWTLETLAGIESD